MRLLVWFLMFQKHHFFNHFLLCPTETGEQVAKVLRFYVESSLMGHGDCCTDGYWIGQWRGIFFFFLFSWPLASYIYFCLLVCALFFVIEIYFFLITAMQGKPPDWQDFIGIVVLLLINSTISFIEENNAGNAAAALMAGLAPKTKVVANFGWLQDPPWFKLVKSQWGYSNMGHDSWGSCSCLQKSPIVHVGKNVLENLNAINRWYITFIEVGSFYCFHKIERFQAPN